MKQNIFGSNKQWEDLNIGDFCYKMVRELFPICRSITGPGVRETISYIAKYIPNLELHSVPSGTIAFDWTVPDEWFIYEAYVEDSNGCKIVDYKDNNLHVMSYSEPIDCWMELSELDTHLYSIPNQPNAIPYITSYYQKRWGVCLTHEQRMSLSAGSYHVVINSELKPGVLNYGELIIPGESKQEVFLSTYICHPSMANNELSGPAVATALACWLNSRESRYYTYRIIFIPETIGSIVYLSKNIKPMRENIIAGFNITCVGDEHDYSFLPSRNGHTISDRAALHALKYICPDFKTYTWLDRGSDERQYCSHMVDLPVATIMRSKYGEYPEYHTSLDDLSLVTPNGLLGGFIALKDAIEIIENNVILESTVLCEPQLGKRGLYPTLSTKDSAVQARTMMNLITYSDGKNTLLDVAEIIGEPFIKLVNILKPLVEEGLIKATKV